MNLIDFLKRDDYKTVERNSLNALHVGFRETFDEIKFMILLPNFEAHGTAGNVLTMRKVDEAGGI